MICGAANKTCHLSALTIHLTVCKALIRHQVARARCGAVSGDQTYKVTALAGLTRSVPSPAPLLTSLEEGEGSQFIRGCFTRHRHGIGSEIQHQAMAAGGVQRTGSLVFCGEEEPQVQLGKFFIQGTVQSQANIK